MDNLTFPPLCCVALYYVEVQQIGGKARFSALNVGKDLMSLSYFFCVQNFILFFILLIKCDWEFLV